MSLGENLQFLRKRNNLTQEQLAEKLDVSRQSVSKWESDTTYPEMEKLIQLCQMFHCSMDDLIQKDISKLNVEDKANYDAHINLFSKMISLGIALILFGIFVMALLEGIGIDDELSTVLFFIFVIIAVAIFIVMGLQHSDFEKKNPYIENFYNEKEIDRFHKKFVVMITVGVVLILIGVLVSAGAESFTLKASINKFIDADIFSTASMFLFLSIAVPILVYAGLQDGKYNIEEYNASHDKESDVYKRNHLHGRINGCIMLIAVIIYLITGFVFNEWGMPYVVVFPVFAIICGIVSRIIDMKSKK